MKRNDISQLDKYEFITKRNWRQFWQHFLLQNVCTSKH